MENNLKKQFDLYTSEFDMSDPGIARKYYHSYRVMSLSEIVAKHSDFDSDDYQIIRVVGLLHDYGRFSQWRDYHTYDDRESVDHADQSVYELFEKGEIKKFWAKEEDYDEIYDAIKYHNKYEIPEHLSDHNRTICKVIRDTDKLDILYLIGKGSIELEETNEPFSNKIKENFVNYHSINWEETKNGNDVILLRLALIFDINYSYSFKHIKEHRLIQRIYGLIKNKEKFDPYFKFINKYIDERIDENA